MNMQANKLIMAVEKERQELIKELSSLGFYGLSDGRTLQELSFRELQEMNYKRELELANEQVKQYQAQESYLLARLKKAEGKSSKKRSYND